MYSVSIESSFSATHQVRRPDGSLEPLHGHDWKVRVRYARAELNAQGMVVDFEIARAALDRILTLLRHSNLNENDVLKGATPTAEVVARWAFDQLQAEGPPGLTRVDVTEAPGFAAGYERFE